MSPYAGFGQRIAISVVMNYTELTGEKMSGPEAGNFLRNALLLFLLALLLYLCWLLARPFLAAITWALALAVVAYPLHRQLTRWLGPNAAALFSTLVVVVVLIVPGSFLVQKILDEASSGFETLRTRLDSGAFKATAEQYPIIGRLLSWLQQRFDLDQELARVARAAAGQASALISGSIRAVTQFAITLVTLFYFLRDRSLILGFVNRLLPLSQTETAELFRRVSETISATLYGNVLVKLVQGLLGGIMFWILGVPAPVLAGAAIALAAMVPVVGTSLVWGPAAILLLVQGSWLKAIILTLWGSLIISLIDNLIYPMLVASGLRLHTLSVFLSIFGGLIAFGFAGVVLGPVILASTVALLDMWRLRIEEEKASSPLA